MTWNYIDNQFVFTCETGEEDLEAILSNLTDNNIGFCKDASYHIPADGIYELSDGQRKLLDIPAEYPYFLSIEADGLVNKEGFRYIPRYYQNKRSGRLAVTEQQLPLVTLKFQNGMTVQYLLPESQYQVLKEIETENSGAFKDAGSSYRSLGRIKTIASEDKCILFDDYLDSYEVTPVEQFKLKIDYLGSRLKISPEIVSDDQSSPVKEGDFARKFDGRTKVLPVYTVETEDGKEQKIVIPENSEPQLREFKEKFRTISNPDQIRKIIESPESFLDEELFDLREFYSDRVIQIGLYKPTFYPFVCPYKSEWIPGFTIEDKYNGNTNIILKEEKDIEELEVAIQTAEQSGSQEIDFRGYKLDLEKAKRTLAIAKRQNANPKTPVTQDGQGKKVLIIEENAESLGYKVENLDISSPELFKFYEIRDLRKNIVLKEHQTEGIAWLQYLVQQHNKGCLLADDMGLGKTLQVLCFIDWHNQFHNPHKKPYLIVAPVSLLNNWEKEVVKFMKDDTLTTTIVHGGKVSKKRNDDDISWLKSRNIILTNYETVRSCQFNICAVDYAAVILDEAQKIKSPGTYVTCAAKALKADFKIAMTGTPVENSFVDLWCIMDFAIPGLLGNAKAFASQYQRPLKEQSVDVKELGKHLRDVMGVFFMRRCKADVLKDLPEKNDIRKEVVMSPIQEQQYIREIIEKQAIMGDGDGSVMLSLLNTLRKISDSPLIADKSVDIESVEIKDIINSSAKIQETISILNQVLLAKEKAIIFCIYKETQRMLQRVIAAKYHITPKIINGDTKVVSTSSVRDFEANYSRQQAIDSFEEKPGFNVIIMSPIAAGMGLNITAANHVIHFGRHWNPAKESQATDRAYRIGQTKPVNVYYPITKLSDNYQFKSFDQTLDELLSRKTHLAEATLYPTEQAEVQIADFKEMFESINNNAI